MAPEGKEKAMRRLVVGLVVVAVGAAAVAADNGPPEGFAALFNGKDLTGWEAKNNPGAKPREDAAEHWKIEDGVIKYNGKCTTLWTKQSFIDFALMVDWRLPKPGDSGIYVRGSSKCQANIWPNKLGSGEVWGYRTDNKMSEEIRKAATPKKVADKPVGEWNSFVITVQGDRMTVVLNGETVIDNLQMLGCPKTGPIALQHHGQPVEFRSIYIKELKAE